MHSVEDGRSETDRALRYIRGAEVTDEILRRMPPKERHRRQREQALEKKAALIRIHEDIAKDKPLREAARKAAAESVKAPAYMQQQPVQQSYQLQQQQQQQQASQQPPNESGVEQTAASVQPLRVRETGLGFIKALKAFWNRSKPNGP